MKNKKFNNLQTGFKNLDCALNGINKPCVIAVGARPSMGKTAFALDIVANVALKSKVPVAVFSLEISREQLVQRMICSETEIDIQRVKNGNLQSEDFDNLARAMKDLSEAPIFIDDTGGSTLTDICAKCRRLAMMEKDLGLVVIDYLQLIAAAGNDRKQEISEITRGLKILARELNVPIIVLTQLSRKVEDREDKRPMLSDLRSGAIEQDADIVMLIHREDYYKKDSDTEKGLQKAEIIIAKNNYGFPQTVELKFLSDIPKFAD